MTCWAAKAINPECWAHRPHAADAAIGARRTSPVGGGEGRPNGRALGRPVYDAIYDNRAHVMPFGAKGSHSLFRPTTCPERLYIASPETCSGLPFFVYKSVSTPLLRLIDVQMRTPCSLMSKLKGREKRSFLLVPWGQC